MAEVAAATPVWRGIDELAELVGAYCWVEHRIFELAGAWAAGPADGEDSASAAEVRVWCAAASRRHGALAGRWCEHLPVRAGVDPAELVRAPAGTLATALDALAAEPEGLVRTRALVEAVLPRVGGAYEAHLRTASPVSEGSVMELLVAARRELAGEIRDGTALLDGLPQGAGPVQELAGAIERAFDSTSVFPAVRTS